MVGPSQDRGNPEPSLGLRQNYTSTKNYTCNKSTQHSAAWPQKSEVRSRQMNFGACVVNASAAIRPEPSGEGLHPKEHRNQKHATGSSPHRRRPVGPN